MNAARLDLAVARVQHFLAVVIQWQRHDPRRDVIPLRGAQWERRVDLTHAVHVVHALVRDVERLEDVLTIVFG